MFKTNKFPVIIVHGLMGYGDEEILNQVYPCFGLWNGDAAKAIRELGIDCYTPSVGPFSSVWDRACVLYAKFAGGTVDYGKVHSEKYGHARFGKTYDALIQDWGKLDDEGKRQKINLIGHSFGGPTVRAFMNLLVNGSQEEREATTEHELSPLFKGGKGDWVHTCIALASTHEGVTLPDTCRPVVKPLEKVLFSVASLMSQTRFSKIYDFHLDHFGITKSKDSELVSKRKLNSKEINHYISLDQDNIFYELSLKGGQEITKGFSPYEKTYYFSYAANRSWQPKNTQISLPTRKMWPPLMITSLAEGLYVNEKNPNKPLVGKDWRPNDGLVNVESAKAPKNEPQTDFVSTKDCKPGIWYKMPIDDKDHLSYIGIGEKTYQYSKYYCDIIDIATDLPVIE